MDAAVISGIVLAVGVIISGIYAAIRGAIRAGQYLVRSEEAQAATARSNEEMARNLDRYMQSSNTRFERLEDVLGQHGQELAVLRDRTARKAADGTA